MRRILFIWLCLVLAAGGLAKGEVLHETLYETSFDTADAVADWEVISGTWQLDSNAGTYTGSGTERILSVYQGPLADGSRNSDLRNYVVTTELGKNEVAGGLCGRYIDAENYYLFRHHPDGELQT